MASARRTDPGTSHEAAASVSNISATQEAILKALVRPGTDLDILGRYRNMRAPLASESGLRSRRAELVAAGLVKDSGARVRLASGRNAIVWEVA